MPAAWSPILVQQIEIHALGFVLRRLQLNRHRDAEVAPHRHPFAQLILYLSGGGVQLVNGHRRAARTGDLFLIPPHTPHGFAIGNDEGEARARRRPVCLVLDYELERAKRLRVSHRTLSPQQVNELHALLARVPSKGPLKLRDYATILAVVGQLLDERPGERDRAEPPLLDKVRDMLRVAGPLSHLSRRVGYHPDHLSRKLKAATGLGLRAHRDRLRLETAQAALEGTATVAEAATRAGFDDPNYFSRWFRSQTGEPPSAWLARRTATRAPSKGSGGA